MAKYSSAQVGYLLLGPYNLTNVSTAITVEAEKRIAETTPFAVAAAQFEQTGMSAFTVTGHDAFYDDGAASINAAMVSLAAGEHVFMLALQGNAIDTDVICAGGALKANFDRKLNIGEFWKAAMNIGISGAMHDAHMVAALTARAGDTNTQAGYASLGAAGAAGGYVYAAATSLTLDGRTDVVLTLQDSADHIAWADHTAMTALTDIGAERKALAADAINEYVAMKQAFTGAGGSPTVTATMAVWVA